MDGRGAQRRRPNSKPPMAMAVSMLPMAVSMLPMPMPMPVVGLRNGPGSRDTRQLLRLRLRLLAPLVLIGPHAQPLRLSCSCSPSPFAPLLSRVSHAAWRRPTLLAPPWHALADSPRHNHHHHHHNPALQQHHATRQSRPTLPLPHRDPEPPAHQPPPSPSRKLVLVPDSLNEAFVRPPTSPPTPDCPDCRVTLPSLSNTALVPTRR